MVADPRLIAGSDLFRDVGEEHLQAIADIAVTEQVGTGTNLFRLGDAAEHLYLVVRGQIALTLPIEVKGAARDVTVDEKGPAEVVGWSALVAPFRSTLTARALMDSELYAFPGPRLLELLHAEPEHGMQVMGNLAAVVGRRLHQMQAMWIRELQRLVASRYA